MTTRILVYTCVFGGYDRVYPPVHRDPAIDYVLVTDDPAMSVAGWRTLAVDRERFGSEKAPNRHFKMLAHRNGLAGYDVSVYVDGNIRVIGRTAELVSGFLASGCAFGSYRHPVRSTVAEERDRCLANGKLRDAAKIDAELDAYRLEGFDDTQGLMETGVVLKNHAHPALEPAMDLWWAQFDRYDSRDQIALPFVLWKLDLPTYWIEPSFRRPNPYFGIYPHLAADGGRNAYAHLAARSFDSAFHASLLRAWNWKWAVQRAFRRRAGHAG